MEQLKWAERKFDLGSRKEYLPFLIERIKGTAPRIEELMKDISDTDLSKQINKNWSAKERIGHLIDLEELHEARIDQFALGLTELRAADMSNKKTYESDHNQRNAADLINDLRKVRAKFIRNLKISMRTN